jgi:hypothetical protein
LFPVDEKTSHQQIDPPTPRSSVESNIYNLSY